VNPDSVFEDDSMVAMPLANDSVLENISYHLKWPKREARAASEFMTGFFSKSFPESGWQSGKELDFYPSNPGSTPARESTMKKKPSKNCPVCLS